MLTKKEIREKDISNIIHLWANRILDKDEVIEKGNYSFTRDTMELNARTVAVFYKGTFFIKKYDNVRAYGNGTNSRQVVNAVPSQYKILELDNLPKLLFQQNTDESDIEYLVKEITSQIQDTIDNVSYIKEYATNNRITRNIPDEDRLEIGLKTKEDIELLLSFYKKSIRNKVLKTIVETTSRSRRYTGWGRNDYEETYPVKIKSTLKDILYNDALSSYITEEEWEELAFKQYRIDNLTKNYVYSSEFSRDKYGRRVKSSRSDTFIYDLKTSREIYDDPDKRQRHIERAKERREQLEKSKREKELESTKEWLGKIELYRSSAERINISAYGVSIYPILKMVEGESCQVRTSYGVTISCEEAKKALRLFRIADKKEIIGEKIDHFSVVGVKEGEFPRLVEGKVEFIKQKYIQIGCHRIPEQEIQDFINYYKLDW